MKRTELKRTQTPKRRAVLVGTRTAPKRHAISPATPAQRTKVHEAPCVACGRSIATQPAHLIDRSLTTVGQNEPLAVVPLCGECHREYDDGDLDLLPMLEPEFRAELAFAVWRVGLVATYRRVTNQREVS